jgi:hypothetical protein
MARFAQITQAGYKVVVQWECDFDETILADHPELKTNPIVLHEPLNTRDALYGGRNEAMRVHYKIAEGDNTICICDVSIPIYTKIFQVPYRPSSDQCGK